MCKHSLNLPCHNEETEEIVHKNQRMGIGVTGYLQASEEQRLWLGDCYENFERSTTDIQEIADGLRQSRSQRRSRAERCHYYPGLRPDATQPIAGILSGVYDWPAIVPSSKPSASTDTPSSLSEDLTELMTVLLWLQSSPFAYPEGTITSASMSAIDQLEVVKRLQAEWSDNAVSCTIYYRKDELPEIKEYLSKNYNKHFKSLSFLLHSEHGFEQAPLEEITQEEYEKRMRKSRLITSVGSADFEGTLECEGGVCPVK